MYTPKNEVNINNIETFSRIRIEGLLSIKAHTALITPLPKVRSASVHKISGKRGREHFIKRGVRNYHKSPLTHGSMKGQKGHRHKEVYNHVNGN